MSVQQQNSTEDWAKAVEIHINNLKNGVEDLSMSQPNGSGDNNANNQGQVQEAQSQDTDNIDPVQQSLMNKLLNDKLKFLNHTVSLDVQQKDPNSPLFAAKSFEDLNLSEQLKRALRDMQYEKPSRIQETALPLLLKSPYDNMIAQSQSGTGKTAAFVLAMLSRVKTNKNYPHIICLSPTFELAIQTGDVAKKMAAHCPEIRIRFAVRGEEGKDFCFHSSRWFVEFLLIFSSNQLLLCLEIAKCIPFLLNETIYFMIHASCRNTRCLRK